MEKNGDLLDRYMEKFDIVVTHDGPFLAGTVIIDWVSGKEEEMRELGVHQ
jgi:hypothetical protein